MTCEGRIKKRKGKEMPEKKNQMVSYTEEFFFFNVESYLK